MSAWQPIETAPTNGHVLLYCEETGEQFVAFLGTSIEEGDSAWIYARGRSTARCFMRFLFVELAYRAGRRRGRTDGFGLVVLPKKAGPAPATQ
jgi:hypothetical protein